MRIDIWTIQEEHIVFENVNMYHLSDKERFAVIELNNGKSIEYYPTVDIRRIKLTKTGTHTAKNSKEGSLTLALTQKTRGRNKG